MSSSNSGAGRPRGSIFAVYERLIDLCGAAAGATVLLMTIGITLDVVVRALGLGAIEWMLEATEYALLVMTFLGAPWALREGAHVRVDVLVSALPRPVARVLDILVDLLGIGVSAVLMIWSVMATLASARSSSMVYKVLVFPEWWLYALMAFSGLLLTLEFIRRLVRSLRGDPPVEHKVEVA